MDRNDRLTPNSIGRSPGATHKPAIYESTYLQMQGITTRVYAACGIIPLSKESPRDNSYLVNYIRVVWQRWLRNIGTRIGAKKPGCRGRCGWRRLIRSSFFFYFKQHTFVETLPYRSGRYVDPTAISIVLDPCNLVTNVDNYRKKSKHFPLEVDFKQSKRIFLCQGTDILHPYSAGAMIC